MDVTLHGVRFFRKDITKGPRGGSFGRISLRHLVIFTITAAAMLLPSEASPRQRNYRMLISENMAPMTNAPAQPPWWHNACGVKQPPDYAAMLPPERHALFRNIKPLKTQIKNTLNHFRRTTSNSHYCNIDPDYERPFTQNWLPENIYKTYQQQYAGKSRHEKIKHILPKLHEELQRYAVTFDNLEFVEVGMIGKTAFSNQERRDMLMEIKAQLVVLLCEVENSLNSSRIPLPHRLERTAFEENMVWQHRPNYIDLCVQDNGVMLAYGTYLTDWQKVMNDIGRLRGGKELRRQQKRRADINRFHRRRKNALQRSQQRGKAYTLRSAVIRS